MLGWFWELSRNHFKESFAYEGSVVLAFKYFSIRNQESYQRRESKGPSSNYPSPRIPLFTSWSKSCASLHPSIVKCSSKAREHWNNELHIVLIGKRAAFCCIASKISKFFKALESRDLCYVGKNKRRRLIILSKEIRKESNSDNIPWNIFLFNTSCSSSNLGSCSSSASG